MLKSIKVIQSLTSICFKEAAEKSELQCRRYRCQPCHN